MSCLHLLVGNKSSNVAADGSQANVILTTKTSHDNDLHHCLCKLDSTWWPRSWNAIYFLFFCMPFTNRYSFKFCSSSYMLHITGDEWFNRIFLKGQKVTKLTCYFQFSFLFMCVDISAKLETLYFIFSFFLFSNGSGLGSLSNTQSCSNDVRSIDSASWKALCLA